MREHVLFLDRCTVLACMDKLDPLAVIEEVLRRHATGHAVLPAEGYLPWTNSEGASCRSIAMLGAVEGDDGPVVGVKLINAAISNPAHGRERAGGFSLVFDPETARPRVIAEAGYLSAARTAAYTMLSLRHLGPMHWDALSILGCGTLARTHLDFLVRSYPEVTTVHLYDLERSRAEGLACWAADRHPGLTPCVWDSARDAVTAARVVVTVTTTDRGYLPASWLAPGTFVAHVSLDDLTPDAFLTAQGLFVDDVNLVRDNPRRVLGRLMREAAVTWSETGTPVGSGRLIDATLGQVLLGERPAIRPTWGFVVSNPFGMSILDVGLTDAVYRTATDLGLGQVLTLF